MSGPSQVSQLSGESVSLPVVGPVSDVDRAECRSIDPDRQESMVSRGFCTAATRTGRGKASVTKERLQTVNQQSHSSQAPKYVEGHGTSVP